MDKNKQIINVDHIIRLFSKKVENLEKLSNQINIGMNEIKEILDKGQLNLAIFGASSSGKSTLISSLIAISTNQLNNVKIPTSVSDNTYFPNIIEASPDDLYHIKIVEGDRKREESFLAPDQINRILKEFDDNSEEKLKKLKKNEDFEEVLITIQIPNFPKRFRLIDSPGLTTERMKDQIFKLLDGEYFFSIIVYLKRLTEASENENTYKFFEEIRKKFKNSEFIVCFTQYDKLFNNFYKGSKHYLPDEDEDIREERTRDLGKFVKKLILFKDDVKKISSELKLSKIFINDNLGKTTHSKAQLGNFLKYIDHLYTTKGERIKTVCFIKQLFNKLLEINQKNSYIDMFSNDVKEVFSNTYNNSINKFDLEINSWLNKFDINLETEVNEQIKIIDKEVLKDENFSVRNNYIERVLSVLSVIFNERIKTKLKDIYYQQYKIFQESIPESVCKRLDKLLKESLPSILIAEIAGVSIGGLALIGGISFDLAVLITRKAAENLLSKAVAAFFPFGSVVAGVGIVVGLYSSKDYIGIWKRSSCYEEIGKIFCSKMREQRVSLVENARENFKNALNSIKKLIDLKETMPEIKELMESLKEIPLDVSNDQEIKNYFVKAHQEFPEEGDKKLFVEDLFLNTEKFV